MLEPAREALKSGDESAALERLVEAWHRTRAPAVAELVEILGKRLDKALPRLEGKLSDFHPAWLAVAAQRRAVDLPRLLSSILHTTQQSGVAITKALLERGEALAAWPADPRLSLGIAALLKTGPFNATGKAQQPFWTQLFALVRAHDDARAIDAFAALNFSKIWKGWNDVRNRIAFLQPAVDAVVAELRHARAKAPEVDTRALRSVIDKLGPVDAKRLVLSLPTPKAPTKKKEVRSAPSGDATVALRSAAEALAASNDERALEALLEAWRATHAPAIARLITAVSKRLEAKSEAITGKTRAAIHEEWLAIASKRRPADLPRLLASITHTFHRATDALTRLEALANWPMDPRAAAGVVANLEEIPFHTSSTKPFWTALIEFAVRHGDHGTADALESVQKRLGTILHAQYTDMTAIRTWFRNRMGAAVTELRSRPAPVIDDDIEVEIQRIAAALESRPAPADRLFEAVFAAPNDDEPRQVLSDHLQELGDPRGELIALQLLGADPKRQAALLRRHAKTWLGPLARIASAELCVFERGFLAEVNFYRDASPDAVARTVGNPIWATVRRLSLAYEQPFPELLLRHPIMRSLEHLTLREPAQIGVLLEWDEVPYSSLCFDCELEPRIERAIVDASAKLAKVRAIELGGTWFDSPAKAAFLTKKLAVRTKRFTRSVTIRNKS